MTPSNGVLCAAVHTAIDSYGSALKGTPAVDLGAAAIRAASKRAGLKGSHPGALVMGQVVQGSAKLNPAFLNWRTS